MTNNHQLFSHDSKEEQEETDSKDDIDVSMVSDEPVQQCEHGDYVLIDFDGYYIPGDENDMERYDSLINEINSSESGQRVLPFIQARNWFITLGNGDVIPALEMAIRFLKLNECSIVKCHSKYAYGPYGRNGQNSNTPKVPPNANIIFKLKIKNIVPRDDVVTKTIAFNIRVFREMKKIGNHYYLNDWIGSDGGTGKVRAVKLYNKIANDGIVLLQDLEHGSKERRDLFAIVVDAFNNISASFLREKEYRKAKDAAAQAIQLDPNNMKALCRAAKAALMVGEFNECKMALDTADEIADSMDLEDSFNKNHIQKLRRELTKKKREHKKLEKEIYSQMLSTGRKDVKRQNKILSGTKDITQKRDKPSIVKLDTVVEKKVAMTKEQEVNAESQSFISSRFNMIYVIIPIAAITMWFIQDHVLK